MSAFGAGGGYGGENRGTTLVRMGSNYSDLPVDSSMDQNGNIILYDSEKNHVGYLEIELNDNETIKDCELFLTTTDYDMRNKQIFYSSNRYPYIFVFKGVFGIKGIDINFIDPENNIHKIQVDKGTGIFPFTYVYQIADAEGNLSQTPFGLVQLNGNDREVWQLDGVVKMELSDEFPRESLFYFNGSGYTSPVYEEATFDAATFDAARSAVNTGDEQVDGNVNTIIIPNAIAEILQSDELSEEIEEEESLHGMVINSEQALIEHISEKITNELDSLSEQLIASDTAVFSQGSATISVSTQSSLQSVESIKSIVPTIAKSLVQRKPIGCTLECIDISCPVFQLLEIIEIITREDSLENKINRIRSLVNKYALLKFCMKNKIYFGQPHPKMSNIITGVLTYMIDEMLWMLNKGSVNEVFGNMSAGPISKESKRESRILVLYNLAQNPTTNRFAGHIYDLMSEKSGNASSSFVGGNGPLTIILTLQNIGQHILGGSGTLCETVHMVYEKYYEDVKYEQFIVDITEIANYIKFCMDTVPGFKDAFDNLQLLFSDYDNFVSILSDNKVVIDFCNKSLFYDLIMNWTFYMANAIFMLLRNKLSYQMSRDSQLFRGINFDLINSAAYAAARANFPQFPMFYQMADKNASTIIRQQYTDGSFEGCATFFDLQIALKKKKDDATALFAKTLSEISPSKSKKLMIGKIPIVRQNVDNIVQLIKSYVEEMDNVFNRKTISCESIESIGQTVMVPLASALKNIILGDKDRNNRKPNYSSKILSTAIEHMFEDGVLNIDCILAPRKPPYIASTSNNLSKNNKTLKELQQQISGILISEKKLFPQNSNSNINSIEIPSLDNDAGELAGEPQVEIGASSSAHVFLPPSRQILSSIQKQSYAKAGGGSGATKPWDMETLMNLKKEALIAKCVTNNLTCAKNKNKNYYVELLIKKQIEQGMLFGGAKTRKRKPRKTRKRGNPKHRTTRVARR